MFINDLIQGLSYNIAYSPLLAKALDSQNAAIFFAQFCYWTGKQKDPEGWIYKTREEIYEETALKRRQQETARRILREAGILEEKEEKLSHRKYYRINFDQMKKWWENLNSIPTEEPPESSKNPMSVPEVQNVLPGGDGLYLRGGTFCTSDNKEHFTTPNILHSSSQSSSSDPQVSSDEKVMMKDFKNDFKDEEEEVSKWFDKCRNQIIAETNISREVYDEIASKCDKEIKRKEDAGVTVTSYASYLRGFIKKHIISNHPQGNKTESPPNLGNEEIEAHINSHTDATVKAVLKACLNKFGAPHYKSWYLNAKFNREGKTFCIELIKFPQVSYLEFSKRIPTILEVVKNSSDMNFVKVKEVGNLRG